MDTTEAVVKISQIKLLEYRGIEVGLNPSDKTPIHFYARSGEDLAMASIYFHQGIYSRSEISNIAGVNTMSEKNKERFRIIIEEYLSELVRQWIDHFIYGKAIQSEKILKNLE
jgi:hypothetical protein